jgi:Ca-activated chloride channel homolog
VTDLYDHYVSGLTVENFHVFEDGSPQRDVQVSNVRVPFSLAVVVDTNDAAFAGQALEVFANSELCLIQMAPEPTLTVPFTTNIVDIENHLIVPTYDRRRLLDALNVAATELRRASNPRRAILIVSDSHSLISRFDQLETRDAAAALDVPVYSLNLWQPVRDGWYPVGPALAKLTGGTAADVGGADQAQAAAERIRIELQNMYILQYPQSKAQDGKYRELRVDVQLNAPTAQLSTRYRAGYYAVKVP